MQTAEFSLTISADELKKYYSGLANSVVARANNGLRIQFPANLLLPYVTRNGISGEFILKYHEKGKVDSLAKK